MRPSALVGGVVEEYLLEGICPVQLVKRAALLSPWLRCQSRVPKKAGAETICVRFIVSVPLHRSVSVCVLYLVHIKYIYTHNHAVVI